MIYSKENTLFSGIFDDQKVLIIDASSQSVVFIWISVHNGDSKIKYSRKLPVVINNSEMSHFLVKIILYENILTYKWKLKHIFFLNYDDE